MPRKSIAARGSLSVGAASLAAEPALSPVSPGGPASSDAVPEFKGWLSKKSSSGVPGMRVWQRRFFVLDDAGLQWFEDDSCSVQRGSVRLQLLRGVEPAPDKGESRFVVRAHDAQKGDDRLEVRFDFEADSVGLMKRWVQLIARRLQQQPFSAEAHAARAASLNRQGHRASLAAAEAQMEAAAARFSFGGDDESEAAPSASAPASAHRRSKSAPEPDTAPRVGGSKRGSAFAGGGDADLLSGAPVEARLLRIAGNSTCADCHDGGAPTWASTNLGTLFCIKCAGVHRLMGAHVSKVLSIKIDAWSEAQLQHMEARGNAAVNADLEASLDQTAITKPGPTAAAEALEAYVRAKYELKSFVKGGAGVLPTIEAKSTAQVGMVEFIGILFIRLVSASHLPKMDALGKTDAYARFSLGDRECRSKTCKHSLNPKWSESLSLNVRSEKETLIVKLYDEDRIGKDDFIGQALVPLSDISLDGTPMGFDLTLQLHTKQQPTGGATRASVAVELTFNPLS